MWKQCALETIAPKQNIRVVYFLQECAYCSSKVIAIKWKVKSLSCVRSFATPMNCSLPGFSIHGIFQARVLEWLATSFSRGSSRPRDWTQASHIVGRHFTIWSTREVPEEPGRVQSMGLQRVGHDWATSLMPMRRYYWGKVCCFAVAVFKLYLCLNYDINTLQ